MNDYEETITSIGAAIDKYNPTSECVVWGFGAKFGDGVLRHLFQCGPTPTVSGVDGILHAYRSVFRSGGITMSGPTVFTKALQAAACRARKYVSCLMTHPIPSCSFVVCQKYQIVYISLALIRAF